MLPPLIGLAFAVSLAAAPPPSANPSVTVDQLRALLTQRSRDRDAALAHRLGALQLSERLTGAELRSLDQTLHPGPKTHDTLRLLADASAFLEPPPDEMPVRPAPSLPEQQAMIDRAVRFVAVTLSRLPDFFATRTTRTFDNLPPIVLHAGSVRAEEMQPDGVFSQEITFRDGKEVLGHRLTKRFSGVGFFPAGLTSTGEFGPLPAIILHDSAHGRVAWSHWETTLTGVVAVFQYMIPHGKSHYEVNYCCVKGVDDLSTALPTGMANAYHGRPGYHGTFSVDPDTGALVRITLEALLKASDPITDGGVAIDYAPVPIEGDKSYICPVHSVAISVTRSLMPGEVEPHMVRRINDVEFTDYHRFRATVKMVLPADP
ncbi:MAG: hypothetical protein ACLGXA_22875 [Acidobacteriota bacterium]